MDGTKLITVHDPIASENGNLELALHGSFLPGNDFERDEILKDIIIRLQCVILIILIANVEAFLLVRCEHYV